MHGGRSWCTPPPPPPHSALMKYKVVQQSIKGSIRPWSRCLTAGGGRQWHPIWKHVSSTLRLYEWNQDPWICMAQNKRLISAQPPFIKGDCHRWKTADNSTQLSTVAWSHYESLFTWEDAGRRNCAWPFSAACSSSFPVFLYAVRQQLQFILGHLVARLAQL